MIQLLPDCYQNRALLLALGTSALLSYVVQPSVSCGFYQAVAPKPTNAAPRSAPSDNNLLKADYYSGLELLSNGRCLEAFQAFERAYAQARQEGEARGVDSIAPLIMMGECLYLQGDCGAAMQHYDAALNLSIAARNWLPLLKAPIGRDRPDLRSPRENFWAPATLKAIPYFASSKNWTLFISSRDRGNLTELQSPPANSSPPSASTSGLLQIDALETLRCQSIALRRRYKILGPLAKYNPLSESLTTAFTTTGIESAPEELQLAVKLCMQLSHLGKAPNAILIRDISALLVSSQGYEHPLTASGRLAIAELAIESNELKLAERAAMDATLTSARASQFQHLEEAVELWSQAAFQNGVDSVTAQKTLKDIQAFSQKKSVLVGIRSQIEMLRQAAYRGDRDSLRQHSVYATGLLQPQAIDLPRLEAFLLYANARLAFLDGSTEKGLQEVVEALTYIRGASPLSTASAPLYQLNLTLRLLSSEAISNEIAIELLTTILDSERVGNWKTNVLEELVFQTHDKLEARRAQVLLALQTEDYNAQLRAWESWKAARILQGSLFNGRLTELRRAIHAPSWTSSMQPFASPQLASPQSAQSQTSPPPGGASSEIAAHFPALTQQASQLRNSIQQLTKNVKWDVKKWSEDDRRKWEAVLKSSASQELALWNVVCAPISINNTVLPVWDRSQTLASLSPDDALLAFYSLDGEIYGYYLGSEETESWKVDDSATLETELRQILASAVRALPSQAQVSSSQAPVSTTSPISTNPPTSSSITATSAVSPPPQNLTDELVRLRSQWIPDSVWAKLQRSERWIVSPDGFAWDIPLEMMPLAFTTNSVPTISPGNSTELFKTIEDPVLQSHRVCYTPTLAHIPRLFSNRPHGMTSRVIDANPSFFGTSTVSKTHLSQLQQLKRPSDVVDAGNTSTLPPPLFIKLAADHYISLREQHWSAPNSFPLVRQSDRNSLLADWTPLPWGVPKNMWLLGHERDRLPSENIIEPGDEWLRWTSSLISQGTESILVSRWSVGGESTLQFLDNSLTNLEDSTLSESIQRTIVSMWSEEFLTSGEPLVIKHLAVQPRSSSSATPAELPPDAPKQVSGMFPGLWASYMLLGDTPPIHP